MTKEEITAQLKLDYPTLTKQINDKSIKLNAAEYETTIDAWADNTLAKQALEAEAEAKAQAKAALLHRLGITADEAKLLLS